MKPKLFWLPVAAVLAMLILDIGCSLQQESKPVIETLPPPPTAAKIAQNIARAEVNGIQYVEDVWFQKITGEPVVIEGGVCDYRWIELRRHLVPGDANGDGRVTAGDFGALSNNFGRTGMTWREGDFDGDGRVTSRDFGILSNHFGLVSTYKSPDGPALWEMTITPPSAVMLAEGGE